METSDVPPDYAMARIRASISADEVRGEMETVCRSAKFANEKSAQKLLRYLIPRVLAGEVPTHDEIAVGIFGRLLDAGESHVRGLGGRLRNALLEYYEDEGKKNYIQLYMPPRHYTIFWKHSPDTLLGKTEVNGRILRASKLPSEDEKKALETAEAFWPHLTQVYPVYCDQHFDALLNEGKIDLPVMVRLFFNSIGNHHVFVTTLDRSEIRIYPIDVWLHEWARLKRSNETSDLLKIAPLTSWHGEPAEIENKTTLALSPKLMKFLTIPTNPFSLSLSFHPAGYISFCVPKAPPRPLEKYDLHLVFQNEKDGSKTYYYVLVDSARWQAFQYVMRTETFNLKAYGYIIATGKGDPPEDLRDRLLEKYDAVILKQLSGQTLPSGS